MLKKAGMKNIRTHRVIQHTQSSYYMQIISNKNSILIILILLFQEQLFTFLLPLQKATTFLNG